MHYFKKWYKIWESTKENVVFLDSDDQRETLTDQEKIDLENGYKIIDWIIQAPENWQELEDIKLKDAKCIECRDKILLNYSDSDQHNKKGDAIVTWNNADVVVMQTFIDAMVTEYQTKWKDAVYDAITP